MVVVFRILRRAAEAGWQDFRVQWTWGAWLSALVPRLCFQVIYFALIGQLLHSPERVLFLVVGNSLMVGPAVTMLAVQGTVAERWAGMVPVLIAAPASPLVVFVGRNVEWLWQGVLTSLVVFAIMLGAFQVPTPVPAALMLAPLVAAACLSTYALAIFLGGLLLRLPAARNLVSILASMVLMTLAGVNVRVDFFPAPLQALAQVLPVTHALQATRAALAGGEVGGIAMQAALEVLVGVMWLMAALVAMHLFIDNGRRTGTIALD